MTSDPELSEALRTLAPLGIMVGHRLITPGDEHALLPEETGAFRSSTVQVKRASGAARIVARALLGRLGYKGTPLPKSAAGPPIWPSGILGSLAHDSRVAVAAVGCSKHLSSIGIDIEPAEALPTELLEFVTTARERVTVSADPFRGRLIFVAKEAVYKAVFPLDHCFLDHHDLEIDISDQKATLRNGRVVNIRFCVSTHLVALALL